IAHQLDVLLDRLGEYAVAELRPRRGHHLHLHGGAGHQRGAAADVHQLVEVLLRPGRVGIAYEPPDLAVVRNDVRLDAAGGDGAVPALRRPQVLAQLVEAHAHQLDRVDRVAPVPRVDRAVRGFAVEGELGAD